MPGKNVAVVFFPRFSGLVGPTEFFSAPMPCSLYCALTVTVWHGTVFGTTPTVTVKIQESNDGIDFFDCPGTPLVIPNAIGENDVSTTVTRAWLRVGISLTGAGAATTVWAQGYFELRER